MVRYFVPTGTQPFVPFNYVGGQIGTLGLVLPFFSGPSFGFPPERTTLLSAAASNGWCGQLPGHRFGLWKYPSRYRFGDVTAVERCGCAGGEAPVVFTLAPTYLPDAPFVNRCYGESAFNDFTVGAKWRWTGPNNPIGIGIGRLLIVVMLISRPASAALISSSAVRARVEIKATSVVPSLPMPALVNGLTFQLTSAYHYNSTVKGDMGGTTLHASGSSGRTHDLYRRGFPDQQVPPADL